MTRFFALNHPDQVTHLGNAYVLTAHDGADHLFGVAGTVVVEEEPSVDAPVRALLHAFRRLGSTSEELRKLVRGTP